ncbi:hypothetical protein [Christiangramia forsetii]|uniref:Uncharacterized protein n=2 Tax=Christiangramia forsetii TaxID=411153 RepID=A0M653_CHRFK|nr:hypothetical protein [Christiangramia forsetii]GGG31376.1 hypothetical protein GCM10011532_13570 [Christiangramia forsetii]CAL68098.1 hypothetical protein GFO_3154 [Christiangramia forsetii KT0803]
MKTIELKVNSRIYDRLLWLLRQFNPDDMLIIERDKEQEYLQNELKKIDEGSAKFMSLEDLDNLLEDQIKKYEN